MTDPTPQEIESYLRVRARANNLDPDLIVRQARQESGLNPRAQSPVGAYGVMQLMPGTARDLGVDPTDWRQNIDGGVRYMRQQMDAFGGDTALALAAYNAGPGNARRRGTDWSQYREETRNYVRNITGQDPVGGGGGGAALQPGFYNPNDELRSIAGEDQLASADELAAAGYSFVDGAWVRGDQSMPGWGTAQPAPLDFAYQQRQLDRETAALDQQEFDINMAIQAGERQPSVTAADYPELDRTMGQRFVENVQQFFSESGAGYLNRMLDPQNDGIDPLADMFLTPEIIEGKPVDWVLDRLMGEDRGYFRSVNDETRRNRPMIEAENRRRDIYAARAEADPVRNPGDALAAAAGAVVGTAVSPESWIAPGASATARIGANVGIAAGLDGLLQAAEVGQGVREEIDPVRTVVAAGTAGAISGGGELVRMAVKARRGAAASRGLQVDPVLARADVEAAGVRAQETVRQALGNPEGPRARVLRDPDVIIPFQDKVAAAGEQVAGTPSRTNVFDINMARINTPEDVQAVIVDMADKFAKDADLARRATRSWDETIAASGQVDWVKSMAQRQTGDAVNAETALAYRNALSSSATKLVELAKAVEADPSVANQFAFRKATSVHAAIQNEFMGARAEAGRALNAFKIPSDAPATYLRQVDNLIAEMGGGNAARDLAKHIIRASENGDKAINEMVRGGWAKHTREAIKLVYTNSLLSGLGTPVINAVGTPIAMTMNLITRATAPRFAKAFGGVPDTQVGEAGAILHGYQQALRDMFRLNPMEAARRAAADGGRALRQDGLFRGMAPGIDDAASSMGVPLRASREEAGSMSGRPLSAAAFGVKEDTVLGRALDVIQMIVESPSNITGLTDDFYKVIAARGELHAQAFRQASKEGLEGAQLSARVADLVDSPTDAMMAAAEREMHELTFTRSDGGFEQGMNKIRRMIDDNPVTDAIPIPVATWIMPFLRTPANLTSLAVRSGPLAPFSARFLNALKEGGAAAETAKAQAAVGTALWAAWMGAALQGDITGGGPTNPEQRAAMMREDEQGRPTWQPYSVRIGGRWFSYERMDPVGSNLSLIGDMAELFNNDDWDGANLQESSEIAANAVLAIGSAFFDKTMLSGAMEFTTALTSNDVSKGERFFMSRASGSIPASSALRMVRRGQDPYVRETHDVVSAMRNTIPLLSEDLPVSRDLWGRPRTYTTGLGQMYDAVVPIQTRAEGGNAIDLEILNNGVSVAMPGRSISFNGETISLKNRPDIYSDFLKESGQPAFDHLNAVAEGRHPDSEFYFDLSDGPDGGKAEYIKDVIKDYRNVARAVIIDRYAADIEAMATERTRRREEIRFDQ